MRRELTELERDEHLLRRQQIHEALYPETKHGGDRRSEAFKTTSWRLESFAEDTARKTGLSVRTIQRGVQIARHIAPDVKEAIRDLPVADSQKDLLDLARLPADAQRAVARWQRAAPGAVASSFDADTAAKAVSGDEARR